MHLTSRHFITMGCYVYRSGHTIIFLKLGWFIVFNGCLHYLYLYEKISCRILITDLLIGFYIDLHYISSQLLKSALILTNSW